MIKKTNKQIIYVNVFTPAGAIGAIKSSTVIMLHETSSDLIRHLSCSDYVFRRPFLFFDDDVHLNFYLFWNRCAH